MGGGSRRGAAPVVVDQALSFGALTLEGDGGVAPSSTGGITSASIDSGDASGHWQVSSAGIFTPTFAGDTANLNGGPYTLGCTFTNASGSDTATITINILANTYSYASDSDLTAILAIATATTAGKTFKGRAGNYAARTINNKAWASETTLGAHDSSNKPVFHSLIINGNTSNLTLNGIEVHNSDNDVLFGYLISVDGTASNTTIKNCVIHGKYYDPTVLWGVATAIMLGIGCEGTISTITVEDNEIYQLYGGGVLRSAAGGTIAFNRNTVYEVSSDCIKFAATGTGAFPNCTVNDNLLYDVYGTGPDDHLDFIQWVGASGNTGDWTIECNRNICVQTSRVQSQLPDGTGATCQGIFSENFAAGTYITGNFIGNFICTNVGQCLTLSQAKACVVRNNTICRSNLGVSGTGARIIDVGSLATSGTHVVTDNVSDQISISGSPTDLNNLALGSGGATTPYSTAYTGISGGFIPATVAQALTMFAIKSGGPLDTPHPKIGSIGTGYFDYDANTSDLPRLESGHNIANGFTDQTDVALSTVITSNEVTLSGVSSTGALVTVSGGDATFRVRDGSNNLVRDYSSSQYVVPNGYKITVRRTSSGSNSTAVNTTVTVGSTTDTWTVTTVASGVTFTAVAFDGANDYMNRGAALTGVSDGEQFTLVMRFRPTDTGATRFLIQDQQDNFKIILSSANQLDGYMWSGASERIDFVTSTSFTNADGMMTVFIAGKTTSGQNSLLVYKNDTAAAFTSGPTFSTSGNMDLTPTDWKIFASSAGASPFAGSVEFVWFDTVYYDVSQQTVRDKWLSTQILADGSGPGAQPKVFLMGDATAWNSDTLNLGTGGGFTMTGTVT